MKATERRPAAPASKEEALKIMEARKITSIVVVDTTHRVEGVVHLHDLWRTQMV